jgi:hypothetical protein
MMMFFFVVHPKFLAFYQIFIYFANYERFSLDFKTGLEEILFTFFFFLKENKTVPIFWLAIPLFELLININQKLTQLSNWDRHYV